MHKAGSFIKNLGSRILIVTTQKEFENSDELSLLKTSLERNTDGVIIYDDIAGFPTFKDIDSAVYFARISNANCIIAYGGFESINAAKAIALLAPNSIFSEELLTTKKQITEPPLPLVVIPSRPVMGNECSPFFCLVDNKNTNGRKYYSHPSVFPELVVADPKIAQTLSSSEIAKTGIAILAAAIDTILSKFANELTNSNSLRAIELISKNIIPAVRDTRSIGPKTSIFAASLLAGMAQSSASLGLCYGLAISSSMTSTMDVYQAMNILLPHVMEYNLTSSAGKYVMIAKALDEDIAEISVIEAAIKAVEGIRKIYLELRLPQKLSEFQISKNLLRDIAYQTSALPFLDSLPRELPRNEIETILVAAY